MQQREAARTQVFLLNRELPLSTLVPPAREIPLLTAQVRSYSIILLALRSFKALRPKQHHFLKTALSLHPTVHPNRNLKTEHAKEDPKLRSPIMQEGNILNIAKTAQVGTPAKVIPRLASSISVPISNVPHLALRSVEAPRPALHLLSGGALTLHPTVHDTCKEHAIDKDEKDVVLNSSRLLKVVVNT